MAADGGLPMTVHIGSVPVVSVRDLVLWHDAPVVSGLSNVLAMLFCMLWQCHLAPANHSKVGAGVSLQQEARDVLSCLRGLVCP